MITVYMLGKCSKSAKYFKQSLKMVCCQDVIHCERVTGGNPALLDQEPFAERKEAKVDYSKIFGDHQHAETSSGTPATKAKASSGTPAPKPKASSGTISVLASKVFCIIIPFIVK